MVWAWERRCEPQAPGASGRSRTSPPGGDRMTSRRSRNYRPGVMSADAALVYLRRFGVMIGRRIAIATNNDEAYSCRRSAQRSRGRGRIFDARPDPPRRSLRVSAGAEVEGVIGAPGVEGVRVGGQIRARPTLCCSRAAGRRPSTSTPRCAASCATTRRSPRSCRALGRGRHRRGRGQRRLHPRRSFAPGPCCGRRRRRRAERAGRPLSHRRRLAEARRPGRRWIDFQSDVS